jgi:hypothetical protein
MSIFLNTYQLLAPSKVELHLGLLEEERVSLGRKGSTAVIAQGLKIEESQLALTTMVRKLGRKPSAKERLNVEEKRERLQARIDAFHMQAMEFWGTDLDEVHLLPPGTLNGLDDGSSDTEDSSTDEEDVFASSPWMDMVPTEVQPLTFPSNLGMTASQEEHSVIFAKQEKTL